MDFVRAMTGLGAPAEAPKAEAPTAEAPGPWGTSVSKLPDWAKPGTEPILVCGKKWEYNPGTKPDLEALVEKITANCKAGTPNESEDVMQLSLHSPCNGLLRVEGDDQTPYQILRRFHSHPVNKMDDGSRVLFDVYQVRQDGKWTWKCGLLPEKFGNGSPETNEVEELIDNLKNDWEEYYAKAV